jgi:hypothetical protein
MLGAKYSTHQNGALSTAYVVIEEQEHNLSDEPVISVLVPTTRLDWKSKLIFFCSPMAYLRPSYPWNLFISFGGKYKSQSSLVRKL